MKQFFVLIAFVFFVLHSSAQKFDREVLTYQNIHIPSRLIYDQVKTYGVNVIGNNSAQFSLDPTVANGQVPSLHSYEKTDFATAHLKVYISYGPYSYVDERTSSETKEEKVDSVMKKVTYYKRIHSFRYPMTYKVVNSRNNTVLYQNEYSSGYVRTIETMSYKTEAEAAKSMNDSRPAFLTGHINALYNEFMAPCNSAVRDQFDFYPTQNYLDIYRIKKWDKDDEYNAHIKNIQTVFKAQPATEPAASLQEKIKDDLAYLQSYEGKFNPKDKKEDILFFVNYYNLATVYYCLDDFEKASFYAQKLDSNNKQDGNTAYFKKLVTIAKTRTAKHLLSSTKLDYNPVKDFRLAGKEYVSDAGALPTDMVATTPISNTPAEPAKVFDQTGNTKQLLHTIWLAYQSWTNGNTDYSEPGNYIADEKNNMATGQQFLYPVYNKKYITIKLNISGQTIPSATIEVAPNTYKVLLTWKEDKLTGIKMDGLSDADYNLTVDKDNKVTAFTSRTMINGNITTVLQPEFTNGKLSKVTKYENKTGQSPWIRSIKTFTYTDTATLVDCLIYGTNKPNTPKGIVSTMQGVYKKSSGNPYIISQPYGEVTEISYNERDDIIGKIVRKKNAMDVHDYTYRDGKLFKETVITRNLAGDVMVKNVRIDFTWADAGPGVPDDEKLQGSYRYDQQGVLIYEARDSKYREKQNGVWSEWKNFRY